MKRRTSKRDRKERVIQKKKCVVFNENKNESRKEQIIFNITEEREMTEDEENK